MPTIDHPSKAQEKSKTERVNRRKAPVPGLGDLVVIKDKQLPNANGDVFSQASPRVGIVVGYWRIDYRNYKHTEILGIDGRDESEYRGPVVFVSTEDGFSLQNVFKHQFAVCDNLDIPNTLSAEVISSVNS